MSSWTTMTSPRLFVAVRNQNYSDSCHLSIKIPEYPSISLSQAIVRMARSVSDWWSCQSLAYDQSKEA